MDAVASAASAVSASAGHPAQSAASADAAAAPLESLPSGAFLTEAALGEEASKAQPPPPPPADTATLAEEHCDKEAEDDEEDEFEAFQIKRAQEARRKEAEAEAEAVSMRPHSDEQTTPAAAAPSPFAADQSLVVHQSSPGNRRVSRKSAASLSSASAAPPRAHLFAYTSLFGRSRLRIAASRSQRLQSIEAQYDDAMTQRTLEATHRALLAELSAEECARDKREAEAIRSQQKQRDRIREAQRRKAAQEAAQLESVTTREMEAMAADRRAAQRKHDAALAAKEARRLAEMRTRALIETHKAISARWADDESSALDRFAADRESRLRLTKDHRSSEAGSGPAWRAKVAALRLTDPLVVQHALGYAHPHPQPPAHRSKIAEEKSAESTAASNGRTRLPPVTAAAAAASASCARTSPRKSRAESASSASSSPRRRYRSPRHGKGAPRHANPINDYHGDNGRTRPDPEPITPRSEDERYEEEAARSRDRSRSREHSPHAAAASGQRRAVTVTSGGSVAVASRSSAAASAAAGAGFAGGASHPRSPSSRYALPRKHASVAGSIAAADSNAAAALTPDDASEPVPPLLSQARPSEFAFWRSALECAAALDPVGVPVAAGPAVSAELTAWRAQEEHRLMTELERQFKALFNLPLPLVATSEEETAAAAGPVPLTYAMVVGHAPVVRVTGARGGVAAPAQTAVS